MRNHGYVIWIRLSRLPTQVKDLEEKKNHHLIVNTQQNSFIPHAPFLTPALSPPRSVFTPGPPFSILKPPRGRFATMGFHPDPSRPIQERPHPPGALCISHSFTFTMPHAPRYGLVYDHTISFHFHPPTSEPPQGVVQTPFSDDHRCRSCPWDPYRDSLLLVTS